LRSLIIVSIILTGITFCYADQSKLTTFPRPEIVKDASVLEKPACVSLDSSTKICQGLAEDAASGAKFVVMRNDETVGEWESEVFLGETADYQVFRGDLDADGRDELVVANRNGISNGMGVNYWTIAVTPFPLNSEKLNPVQFQTEDFSVGAMFVPRKKSGGFDIMAANWQTLPVKKSNDRTALYYVGRWLIYRNNELETSDRPILVRRYLSAFERERLKNINDKNNSHLWLNSKSTEKRPTEPLADLIVKSETDGTIESVVVDKSSENRVSNYKISLRTKAGEVQSLTYPADSDETDKTFEFVGNYAEKRLYPKGYLPKKLTKGKSVKLIVYADSKNEPLTSRILWLTN
jgi:hypothetical protein